MTRASSEGGTFAGILAAGSGQRFARAGVKTPKALVRVGGKTLIRHTLDAFFAAGFARVAVVTNDAFAPELRAHVREPRVDWTVRTTASTLETFTVLLGLAANANAERFVFTTVDAVGTGDPLARFANAARDTREPLLLGVAPIDPADASPLRVAFDDSGFARLGGGGDHATAGYYAGAVAPVRAAAERALREGLPSLRAFLTAQSGLSVVRGMVLGPVVDVDTPEDVVTAERLIADGGSR